MAARQLVQSPKETPMERIFRKVVGRKMTSFEKICFQLDRGSKPSSQNGANVVASKKIRSAKLTPS